VLEQTLPIASCIIHNDAIELPFKARSPGKDYYVIWDEGIVTNCTCENLAVDNATTWTFTTSEIPVAPYTIPNIGPTGIPTDGETSDQFDRSGIPFSQTPSRVLCSASQKMILNFSGKVIKGTGSITIKDRLAGSTVATLSVASATLTYTTNPTTGAVTATKVDFGTIPTLAKGKYFDVSAPRGLLVTESVSETYTYCDKTVATPAPPQRRSLAKTWGLKTEDELRLIKVEYCPENSGNARQRTNIKLTFNKTIKIKSSSPAEVTIFGGLFGSTFQKIDLRGTYANKKYGDIYDADSSAVDNPDTGNVESVSNNVIIVNPTKMMDANTSYYMNIPSGVIIDASCDIPWDGVTDSTTIKWKTDGADLKAPPATSTPLTYGSVKYYFKVDRMVVPGTAKLNVITPAGKLKTQVNASDIAIKFKHNEPF
jgi:hypothetical protein